MGHGEYVCCRSKRRTHPHSRTGISDTPKGPLVEQRSLTLLRANPMGSSQSVRVTNSKKAQEQFLRFLLVPLTNLNRIFIQPPSPRKYHNDRMEIYLQQVRR